VVFCDWLYKTSLVPLVFGVDFCYKLFCPDPVVFKYCFAVFHPVPPCSSPAVAVAADDFGIGTINIALGSGKLYPAEISLERSIFILSPSRVLMPRSTCSRGAHPWLQRHARHRFAVIVGNPDYLEALILVQVDNSFKVRIAFAQAHPLAQNRLSTYYLYNPPGYSCPLISVLVKSAARAPGTPFFGFPALLVWLSRRALL